MIDARALSFLALSLLAAGAKAEDWPQWLGPNRNGLTAETGLLPSWPAGGPERVWLFDDCGKGYSGPAIVGGKLYVMGSRNGVEQLICLDEATGEELWKADLGEEYTNGWGDGPRGTPTVDEGRVYVLAARGELVCLDARSGAEQWRITMQELGGSIPQWGYAESPLVVDGRVVVTPGGPDGAIAAFDKLTGEKQWQTASLTDGAHYASLVVAEPHGVRQYVQLLPNRVVGIEPETGEVLWQVPFPGKVAVIPTPLVKDNHVYVTAGYGVGCMLIEIAEDGAASVVYDNKIMKDHHGGVLLLDGRVYGHSDGVGWVCQDFATGDRVWRERRELGKGAIAYADGRFYCQSEDEGDLVLIEASPEGWKEHGRFTLEPQSKIRADRGKIWTHPVIANGKMYLRDQDLLFCFDVAAE